MLADKSTKVLREIDPDLLLEKGEGRTVSIERRAYNYVRRHFDEHQVLPTPKSVAENTGIVLPEVDEPCEYYFRRVRERALTNNVMGPYNRLQEALQNPRSKMDDMQEAIEEMYRVKARFLDAGTGIETSDGLIDQVMADYRSRIMSSSTLRGITTGYAEVDEQMDGYNGGDFVVWVARPGRSKSWMLLKQAHAAWKAGHKPLYVSMEMGGVQNMRRMIGIHSGINPTFIKKGQVQTLARPILQRAIDELLELRPLPMVTANFTRTVDQIAAFVDEHRPSAVYIDAGYLLSPRKKRYGSSGRRETISDVAEELKELGANAGIPIITTVQFNRNAEHRRRSRDGGFNPIAHLSLAEIGETDVLGQVASHVFGIELPPDPLPMNAYRVFGFLKGREGESGWWLTNFMPEQYSPVNLDIVPRTDPVYEAIARAAQRQGASNSRRNPSNTPPAERTALMRLNQ